MRTLAVLGSTGSIGVNALDVVRRLNRAGRSLRVAALTAHSNLALLKKQIIDFRPTLAVVGDAEGERVLKNWAKQKHLSLRVRSGVEGLVASVLLSQVDGILLAVVGSVGLTPLLAALRAGKDVALANKESLIVAGPLVMETARRHRAQVIPVDSEHSALFQCLGGRPSPDIRRLVLTASGGAFYRRKGSLSEVQVAEALDHPTWKMGKKITVDCATLTNKGLEAIEAHHLFQVPLDQIEIVIHPQSIVHSLVEFQDGSMLAQLSHPDMRLPIQYALTYPDRLPTPVRSLQLEEIRELQFFPPDFRRFPSLALALEAGRQGGTWPTVFNGANEVAVRAFLHHQLTFTGISTLCRRVMERYRREKASGQGLSAVLKADAWSRQCAGSLLHVDSKGGQ